MLVVMWFAWYYCMYADQSIFVNFNWYFLFYMLCIWGFFCCPWHHAAPSEVHAVAWGWIRRFWLVEASLTCCWLHADLVRMSTATCMQVRKSFVIGEFVPCLCQEERSVVAWDGSESVGLSRVPVLPLASCLSFEQSVQEELFYTRLHSIAPHVIQILYSSPYVWLWLRESLVKL